MRKVKILFPCITCRMPTPHAYERHHSGENLWRCTECHTWTLARPERMGYFGKRKPQNLRANPASREEVQAAVKLADDFSGHKPTRALKVRLPPASKVRLAIGEVTAVQYRARRDGVTNEYRHRFAQGSRPQLVVTPDGKRLELLGGAFKFTDRGIVDSPRRPRR